MQSKSLKDFSPQKIYYNQKYSAYFVPFRKKPCVYKITSPIGSVYIGQTINITQRLTRYRSLKIASQKKLYASFVKYGFDSHFIEVIEVCSIEQLDDAERKYIELYDSFNNGLNLTSGGRSNYDINKDNFKKAALASVGKKQSQEVKDKRIATWKKYGYPMSGKKHSDEAKRKMSEARKGIPIPKESAAKSARSRMGLKRKESTIALIREKQLIRQKKMIDEGLYKPSNKRYHINEHKYFLLVKGPFDCQKRVFESGNDYGRVGEIGRCTITKLMNNPSTKYKNTQAFKVKMYF